MIPTVWDCTNVFNLALPLNATLGGSNAYAGIHVPDIVGNLRVDQAWGLFQISAAAHEVSGSYNILNRGGSFRQRWYRRRCLERPFGNHRPPR